jgi:hypothetical protein
MSLKFAINHFQQRVVTAVECGVAAGNNAQQIFNHLRLRQLFLVDTWSLSYNEKAHEWLTAVMQKFEGEKKVVILRTDAIQAARLIPSRSVNYLYLDDCHNPEHLMAEIDAWRPKMARGGIIAGHDFVLNRNRVDLAVRTKFKRFSHCRNPGEDVEDWWALV